MAVANKQGKMQGFINYRMRATLVDGRQLVGQMLAFDKHMNLVMADCEEFRKVKRKTKAGGAPGAAAGGQQTVETEEKRTLGLAIIRGAIVVSCSVDGPPPADPAARLGTSAPGGPGAAPTAMQAGPGISRPAGRGAGVGLQGPAAGVGGPGFGAPFGAPPGGFPGRGGPPPGFPGMPPPGFAPPGFQPPPGGRGFGGAPPGFQGR
ncbi:hypothetical protein LTR08_007529 [Meristemomyces frigidus]|nr:hypothetical protein LTR08_007529 [Meristemomyces frigidus]